MFSVGYNNGTSYTIQNLILQNFYVQTSANAFCITSSGSGNTTTVTFLKCGFGGKHQCGGTGISGFSEATSYCNITFEECDIKPEVNSIGFYTIFKASNSNNKLNHCQIEAKIISSQSSDAFIYNNYSAISCLFNVNIENKNVGLSQALTFGSGGMNNIFEITTNKSSAINGISSISLYNSDLLPDGVTITGANVLGVTSEQMTDAQFLNDAGFPIGVE